MSSLLIHGCYDSKTFETLRDKKISEFAFDLRPRSFNLISFSELTKLLKNCISERIFLTFANERPETILSYLGLLKNHSQSFTLLFRDQRERSFYENLNVPFYWMFESTADWASIMESKNLQGIFLPLKFQNFFHRNPEFWQIIEEKNLDVYLHAENFEQSLFVNLGQDMKLSIDLTSEVEDGYRKVDQDRMKNMKIWRFNESSSR